MTTSIDHMMQNGGLPKTITVTCEGMPILREASDDSVISLEEHASGEAAALIDNNVGCTKNEQVPLVPEAWQPDEFMLASDLRDALLIKVETDEETKTVQETEYVRGYKLLEGDDDVKGVIALVIRRPGCQFCREQAQTICEVMTEHPEKFKGVRVVGIVKETNSNSNQIERTINDAEDSNAKSVAEFSKRYFSVNGKPLPLYRDQSFAFYQALGSRSITSTENIRRIMSSPFSMFWKMVSIFVESFRRVRSKSIEGDNVGEGLLQGGLIGFDAVTGQPLWEYKEELCRDISVDDFLTVVQSTM